MSKMWTIQRIAGFDGQAKPIIEDVITIHELEYHGEWMGKCFVTVNIKSPDPIDWHFDDFLEYRGEVFTISYDPNVVKKARRGTYAEGFTYDNIKFYAIGDKTRFFGFKDVVLNQNSAANTQVYTSLATFSFFCSSVEDFADRLQANLDREDQSDLMRGRHFTVLTPSALRTTQRLGSLPAEWNTYFDAHDESQTVYIEGETDVNIDIDKQNCYDVLKYSYDKFGLSYFVKGTTIVIGGKPIHLNTGSQNIFRYGKGLGLYEVERTSDEDIEIVTKLFAYGSEQNLPLNYYANKGKKVFFNVACKSEREYISGHPTLNIWTNKTLSLLDLKNIFGTSQKVTLKAGNTTISATVSVDTYAMGPENEDSTLPHNVEYAFFSLPRGGFPDYDDTEARAFYNSVSNGSKIYILNADINKAPSDWIEIPQGYDYPAALSVNKLMLPGFPDMSLYDWVSVHHRELLDLYDFSQDKKDPWIKSKNLAVAGLFEGAVYYDGSQQREIFPTIENTAAGVVVANTEITDNGYIEGGSIAFTLKVADSILDWENALNTAIEDVYVEMKSGFCVGRKFKVNSAKIENGVWVLNADRDKDSSTGRYFPYFENNISNYAQVLNGDTFVVTGIQMPDEYIEAAAEKMLIAACGHLDKRNHMRYTYLPKIDELFMQRDHDNRGDVSYYSTICAGMKLEFEDTDLGIWQSPYIDQLTIKENGNNGIPTYDVVLRDEKEKSKFEKMAERIEELTGATQIVERQQRTLQYVEYPEWDDNGLYYFEMVNPDTDVLETSRVWHRGCLWECHRTLTQQEPWFTSSDWVCLRMNNINLGFYTDEDPPMPILMVGVKVGYVDETIVPYLLVGQEDISSTVTAWEWVRESGNDVMDEVWKNSKHTDPEDPTSPLKSVTRTLHITDDDLPENWWLAGTKISFKCTATFPYESGESAEIINSITII